MLPDNGLGAMLSRLPFGTLPEKWFTPSRRAAPSVARVPAGDRLRAADEPLCGVPLPRPEPVPIAEAVRVARWIAETVARSGGCHLRAYVSLLVRVAQAAREAGLDLTGARFGGGGEPPTPAKIREIDAPALATCLPTTSPSSARSACPA